MRRLNFAEIVSADFIREKIVALPNWVNSIALKCNIFKGYIYGRKYIKYRNSISKISSNDIEQRLINIVNFAIKNVKYYRDRYSRVEINTIEDFKTKIGFIDKAEVMAHWDDFLVNNIELNKCKQGTTGGTSGKPLKLVLPQNRYIVELATIHSLWKETGWDYNTRGVIRNHKLPDNKVYIINPITKEVIFDAFRISLEYAKQIYDVLVGKKIKYIHAYPSAAYQFCKLCTRQNLNLNFINSFICHSEDITQEQYYFIHDTLGINMYSVYGHSEKLIIAGGNLGNHQLKVEPSYGYAELVDEKGNDILIQGNSGEIVGTTLYNQHMPLIRYKTGDTAEYRGTIGSGHTILVFDSITGRWEKNLIYRNDNTVTSTTALNLHDDLYKYIDGMQYIQNEKGKLIILLIKNEKYTSEIEKRFIEHFKRAMGKQSTIEIKYVDKLTLMPNGKFLPLISKIALDSHIEK
jgi:phenylacetate-CoA ligase